MDQGSYKEKVLLSLGLILLFSSSSARYISEFKYLNEPLFLLGGALIIIAAFNSLIKNETFITTTFKLMTSFYASFMGLVILSIIVNQNLESEVLTLEKYIFIYLFLGVSLALTNGLNKRIIINSFVVSALITFIYFLIVYPIAETPLESYRGGFGNPNSVGVLAVTLFSVSLVAGTSLIKKGRHYLLAFFYLLITIGAGYLTLISNSRTSFITLVIVFAIVLITFIYDVLKTHQRLSWKSILITAVLIVGGSSLFILIDNPAYAVLEATVLDKFSRKIESGGLTAGRVPIWTTIIDNAGLFGKGSGYFSEISGNGAHNSFLHIVSLYGWLAATAYTLFWLVMLIKSIHYYLTEKLTNIYALLPLVLIINYISVSMMENMTVHVSAFLAISMIAIFSKPKEQSWKA